MASLELRSDRFRIVFRVGGKKLHASLKTTDQREAEGCLARLEENLRLMERGRLVPPPDAGRRHSDVPPVGRQSRRKAPLSRASLDS
jgi:hypothetical protein